MIQSRILGVVTRNMLVAREGEWQFLGYLDGLHLERLTESWDEIHVIALGIDEMASTFYKGADLHPYHFKSGKVSLRPVPGPTSPRAIDAMRAYVRLLPSLWRHIKECDAVYVFMPQWLTFFGVLVSLLQRKPVGVYVGGDWRESGRSNVRWTRLGPAGRLFRWLYTTIVNGIETLVVRSADVVLVHGAAMYQRFQMWNGARRRVCQVTPVLGITAADIYHRADTTPAEMPMILYVGLLVPVKNVGNLLDAVKILRDKGRRLRVALVGDGAQRPALERQRDELGLAESVDFRGHVPQGPQLLHIYREADVFVIPALSEGFPRVVYEAMSQGVPVVATEVGGLALTLKNGENARLVPPGRPDELARAIEEVLTDAELRRRLIAGGYAFVDDVFGRVATNHPAVLVGKYLLPQT